MQACFLFYRMIQFGVSLCTYSILYTIAYTFLVHTSIFLNCPVTFNWLCFCMSASSLCTNRACVFIYSKQHIQEINALTHISNQLHVLGFRTQYECTCAFVAPGVVFQMQFLMACIRNMHLVMLKLCSYIPYGSEGHKSQSDADRSFVYCRHKILYYVGVLKKTNKNKVKVIENDVQSSNRNI